MKLVSLLVTGLLIVGFSNNAMADSYVGGALGQSDLDVSGYDKATSLKVYGGMRGENFGFEAAFIDLGDFDIPESNGLASIETYGLELSAVAFLPVGDQFELFGKVGAFSWNMDAKLFGMTIGSNDGIDLTYAAGGLYKPTKNISIRAEYQVFNNISDADINNFSIGAAYHF